MILIWNNINKFTHTIIIYKHLHSTFLMTQVYGTISLYNSSYLSSLQLPSALSHCGSEHLLKALQTAKAQLLCQAIGELYESHVRSSEAFYPAQFNIRGSMLEMPEVVGQLVLVMSGVTIPVSIFLKNFNI